MLIHKRVMSCFVLFFIFSTNLIYGKPNKKPTLTEALEIPKSCIGNVMYIWGGGRNEVEKKDKENKKDKEKSDSQDGKAKKKSPLAITSLGKQKSWKEFADKQDASYNYRDHCKKVDPSNELTDLEVDQNELKNGLDCSGFASWAVYNTMETSDGNDTYVNYAWKMAKSLSDRGLGEYTDFGNIKTVKPGDIVSMHKNRSGETVSHVYFSLGQCDDKSIVLIDCSPPCVRIRGTRDKDGKKESKAVALAERYMSKYYSSTYKKFPDCIADGDDYTKDSKMSWDTSEKGKISDPDGIQKMSPENVLKFLFHEKVEKAKIERERPKKIEAVQCKKKIIIKKRKLKKLIGKD